MEELIKQYLAWGAQGLIIVSLGIYIIYKEKANAKILQCLTEAHDRSLSTSDDKHIKERAEWREQAREQFDKIVEVTDRNSMIINDLKSLIKTIK